jgi:hypothetical protein
MTFLNRNFMKRLTRLQRQKQEQENIRASDVAVCDGCGRVRFWTDLEDFSTQEYTKLLCKRCVESKNPNLLR